MDIIKTENEAYGFFGTMNQDGSAEEAWNIALPAIQEATGAEAEEVRAFLDSSWGRHFADNVSSFQTKMSLKAAIDAAIALWNGWTLRTRTRKELGIPTPMPYLSGMVYAASIASKVE